MRKLILAISLTLLGAALGSTIIVHAQRRGAAAAVAAPTLPSLPASAVTALRPVASSISSIQSQISPLYKSLAAAQSNWNTLETTTLAALNPPLDSAHYEIDKRTMKVRVRVGIRPQAGR